MKKIVGVRFKPAGKIYDFNAGVFVLKVGDSVIVETEQGLGFGHVIIPPRPETEENRERELKKVFRPAGEKDLEQIERNRELETTAHAFCLSCIKELGLKMNLFEVESTFTANKLTFFFTADGRVDFRELVKMLVRRFRIRIEMRQVGIRNQAKMCGGIGRCGRVLCCSAFLEKFEPVSIRMAKEQGLSLNPTKISGQCGRLMCCLTYENQTYITLKSEYPKIGRRIETKEGSGKVIRLNIIRGIITVRLEKEEKEVDLTLKDIRPAPIRPQHRNPVPGEKSAPGLTGNLENAIG
ncbi:MAG: stage 0 sporulation protein [Desulfococcus sp.]|nr:MAG: stage 0 sporulation protein [Desulfococcus sp.]